MQVDKNRSYSEEEPPLRVNDPSAETNSESGTSVESAYLASASTKQAADALAHCFTSLSLSEGANPLFRKDSGKVQDACSKKSFVAEARTVSNISLSLCEYAVGATSNMIEVIREIRIIELFTS